MKYINGGTINVGDYCWHAEKKQISQVAKIIEEEYDKSIYGELKKGIFLSQDISLAEPRMEMFIAEDFFEEEEVDCLNREEKWVLNKLKNLALKRNKVKFNNKASYWIQCQVSSFKNIPPMNKKWVIKFYSQDGRAGEDYFVNLSEK